MSMSAVPLRKDPNTGLLQQGRDKQGAERAPPYGRSLPSCSTAHVPTPLFHLPVQSPAGKPCCLASRQPGTEPRLHGADCGGVGAT